MPIGGQDCLPIDSLPPVSANATATLTALPGYLSSAWGFREDMRAEGVLGPKAIIGIAALAASWGRSC